MAGAAAGIAAGVKVRVFAIVPVWLATLSASVVALIASRQEPLALVAFAAAIAITNHFVLVRLPRTRRFS